MNKEQMKEYERLLKKATKKAREVLSEINPQYYFDTHQDMTLQYLMDYLNPQENDSLYTLKKKFFSREIATNYFNKYNPPNMNINESNLAIIVYQFFIYRNYSDIVTE